MSEDRVTDLEVKLAFQEHTISQLDEVLQKLVQQVDDLENQLTELKAEHQASLAPLENPPPPHW